MVIDAYMNYNLSDKICITYTNVDIIYYWLQIQKETSTFKRCIHHFKSDLIYNMDHMRISGTESSGTETVHKHINLILSRPVLPLGSACWKCYI